MPCSDGNLTRPGGFLFLHHTLARYNHSVPLTCPTAEKGRAPAAQKNQAALTRRPVFLSAISLFSL